MRIVCSGLIALFALCFSSAQAQDDAPRWSLAIHGGAGVIERASLTPEQDAAYRAARRPGPGPWKNTVQRVQSVPNRRYAS